MNSQTWELHFITELLLSACVFKDYWDIESPNIKINVFSLDHLRANFKVLTCGQTPVYYGHDYDR